MHFETDESNISGKENISVVEFGFEAEVWELET